MPSVNENSDKSKNQESKKKHSFFGGKIDLKTKDLLDFRYNSQEEIDKLNEEIEINEELKDSIEDKNHDDKEDVREEIEQENKAEDEQGAENTLEENLNEIDEPTDNSITTSEYNGEEENEPISGVAVPEEKKEEDNEEIEEDEDKEDNKIIEGNIIENEEDGNTENDNSIESLNDSEEKDDENKESVKFFDPFELNLDEDENEEGEEDDIVNPFGLEEDNENNTEEIIEKEKEDEEATDNEDEEATDNEDEEVTDNEDEEATDNEDEEIGVNNKNKEDDKEEEFIVGTNTQLDDSVENTKHKYKKQIEEEEIALEETDTNEDIYELTEDELFEQEPEFFGDDELSQKFLELVKVARNIFKIERKKGTQDPYYKIIGGKNADSTLEYLFYLIEEEGEPIDLFIKKVETNNSGDENEHLVQFSYDQEQNLNIFVDEIILYEKVNKSEKDSSERNDTKIILEKFTFLSETYYKELKDKREKEQEEKKKKKQLQNIFKEF